jgi:hypothetical protein
LTAVEKVASLTALAIADFGAFRIRTVLAAEEFRQPQQWTT